MFKKIIEFIFGSKPKRIKKQINKKYIKAISFQRNGNIQKYSETMCEIEALEDVLAKL